MLNDSPVKLAVFGGAPIRPSPMPSRRAFAQPELASIVELFNYYDSQDRDFGYQDHFEELYTRAFAKFMGEPDGYADAVCTGSVAVFLAVAALQLPKGAEVIVSPITDPGTITAIIMNQLHPVVADSVENSYNISVESVEEKITKNTKAILVVHAAGQAAAIDKIMQLAQKHNLYVVEDCSQAHGATYRGQQVGTFGDIAAFSTMYRKAHGTGGCGGVVYSKNKNLFNMALAYADRGKPKWRADFQEKDPTTFLFPALNFNQDEISCAIGYKTLEKLPAVIESRIKFVDILSKEMKDNSSSCSVYPMTKEDSPFFVPIFVDLNKISCPKIEFANAIQAEGIVLNPHYKYLVTEWPWAKPYLSGTMSTPRAESCRDRSFNILMNENYGLQEARDIVAAVVKVESYYSRQVKS